MRTVYAKTGTRTTHEAKIASTWKESAHHFWRTFISAVVLRVGVKVLLKCVIERFSTSFSVGTHFRIFTRKIIFNLRTVYAASPQKLARPLFVALKLQARVHFSRGYAFGRSGETCLSCVWRVIVPCSGVFSADSSSDLFDDLLVVSEQYNSLVWNIVNCIIESDRNQRSVT